MSKRLLQKRLLQICPHDVAPFAGLCERYVQAGELIGVQVTTVFLSSPSAEPLLYAHYLCCEDLAQTASVRVALTEYANQNWDMVVCHRYRSYVVAMHSPLAQQNCVVVAHEYGLMSRWQRRLARRLYASNVTFAGVSAQVAEELRPNRQTPAVVLPNVIDATTASQALLSTEEARATLGLDSIAPTIGVVGRLHYKKRPEVAMAAFIELAQRHADLRLVFVGAGSVEKVMSKLTKDCAGQVHDLMAQNRIVVAGPIDNAPRLFRAFDVLLHPTQIEAFGMVVLEAMLAGVPVVTLPKGGPQYVLDTLGVYAKEDSASGFAAAIESVLSGRCFAGLGSDSQPVADLSDYQRRAYERVEQHFSVDRLARALAELLSKST